MNTPIYFWRNYTFEPRVHQFFGFNHLLGVVTRSAAPAIPDTSTDLWFAAPAAGRLRSFMTLDLAKDYIESAAEQARVKV